MAYLFDYPSENAYINGASERSTTESATSFDSIKIHYDCINHMIPVENVTNPDVCIVVEDNETNKRFLIPQEDYVASALPSGFSVKDFICYGSMYGKQLMLWKHNLGPYKWACSDYYTITPTANSGSLTFSVSRSGKAFNKEVSWSGGNINEALTSLAAAMNAVQSTDSTTAFNAATADTINGYVKIQITGYITSTMTVSSTSATFTDLSQDTKFNGVSMPASSRSFQSQTLQAIFGSHTDAYGGTSYYFPPTTTVQYSKGGVNTSYVTGGNLAKFIAYYGTNGSATYVTESSGTSVMNRAGFASCETGTAEAQALYNKYGGSYEAYMDSKMYDFKNLSLGSINNISRDNGSYMTELLANCQTMGFSGYESAYPAFAAAYNTEDTQWGHFHLPTNHEMAMFMEDSKMAKINQALSKIGGTSISNTAYYWSSGEYMIINAWFYYGNSGGLNFYRKSDSCSVRPVLAKKVES
jgi:hypothetical protein